MDVAGNWELGARCFGEPLLFFLLREHFCDRDGVLGVERESVSIFLCVVMVAGGWSDALKVGARAGVLRVEACAFSTTVESGNSGCWGGCGLECNAELDGPEAALFVMGDG